MTTVKDLKEFLKSFPDEMEILERRCSDCDEFNLEAFTVIKAIDKSDINGYYMRVPDKISDKDKDYFAKAKSYLAFLGN